MLAGHALIRVAYGKVHARPPHCPKGPFGRSRPQGLERTMEGIQNAYRMLFCWLLLVPTGMLSPPLEAEPSALYLTASPSAP